MARGANGDAPIQKAADRDDGGGYHPARRPEAFHQHGGMMANLDRVEYGVR